MPNVKVLLPGIISRSLGCPREIEVRADKVIDALNILAEKFGKNLEKRLFGPDGNPRRLINFYLNGKNIKFLDGFETLLDENDEISIVPVVGGG